MATGNPVFDYILRVAETDKVEAGTLMTQALMAGDAETLKLGYSLGAALLATVRQLDLTAEQTALVAGKVAGGKDA